MQIVHSPHVGAPAIESFCGDWLEVRRGRTRFPHRPLLSDRFLIGSGTNCHLQLGGGLPMLHTLLTREQGRWRVEAIAPEPPLLINGTTCRCQTLCPNDVIQLAEFEFVFHHGDGPVLTVKNEDMNAMRDSDADQRTGRLRSVCRKEAGELSASQLVDRLKGELELIDRLGHDRKSAANGLLRAILRQGQGRRMTASPPRAA